MKIQTKIVLLLAILIIFFTNVVYGILRWQIQRYHRDVEKNYIVRILDGTVQELDLEKDELYNFGLDLVDQKNIIAAAEGLSQYSVEDDNDPFNVVANGLNLFIIANGDKQVIYKKIAGIDNMISWEATFPQKWSEDFRAYVSEITGTIGRTGCMWAYDTTLVIASIPIKSGQTHIGSLILGKLIPFLTKTVKISTQLEEVSLDRILPNSSNTVLSIVSEIETRSSPKIDFSDAKTISAYSILYDLLDQPLFLMRVTSTRVFLEEEKRTLLLALFANTVVGLFIAFIVLLLLQKLVISRIDLLVDQVSSIHKKGTFSSRLEIRGKDEVGVLAAAFNDALSKLEEMARRIEKSEERYSLLVEQSRDGVAIIVDGEVRYANSRLLEILGYEDSEELSGDTLGFIVPFERKKISEKIKRQYSLKRPRTLQSKLITKNRKELEVEIDLVSAMFRGESAVFLYIRDVTETKRMDRHLQRVDKLTSLGQLSSGIAHEIRTPLASIQLNIDNLLQGDSLNQDQLRLLENSKEGIRRISDIVQGTLDFARPTEPSFETMQITNIIEDVLTFMRANLAKSNVTIEKQFENAIPSIQADRTQLNQAFLNIILNAIQAMPNGGNLRIWAKQTKDKGKPVLEVGFEDTGFGIAQDCQKRVFDPFYTTKYKGVGLGLSIVHRILEEHQATIDLDSAPGRGTTFFLRFSLKSN